MRKIVFVVGKYYHIYNRGVDKRKIFLGKEDYFRLLKSLKEFNSPLTREERMFLPELNSEKNSELSSGRLVNIIAYCLNPNHYHFILEQKEDGGIKTFMHKIGTGYTNYFNKKYNRTGSLFQGRFKATYIDSNEYLLHLSSYINQNYFIHGYGNDIWEYSSLLDYIGKRKGALCNKEIILSQFDNFREYEDFMEENKFYFKDKKDLERYILE